MFWLKKFPVSHKSPLLWFQGRRRLLLWYALAPTVHPVYFPAKKLKSSFISWKQPTSLRNIFWNRYIVKKCQQLTKCTPNYFIEIGISEKVYPCPAVRKIGPSIDLIKWIENLQQLLLVLMWPVCSALSSSNCQPSTFQNLHTCNMNTYNRVSQKMINRILLEPQCAG